MQAATRQLALAAASHPSLRVLDLSCTALSDAHLRSLTGQCSSRWPWQQQACPQLQELHLGSNTLLTGTGVAHLVKALTAGNLSSLQMLDLGNCPGIGDAGKVHLRPLHLCKTLSTPLQCKAICIILAHSEHPSGGEGSDRGMWFGLWYHAQYPCDSGDS